MTTKQHDVRTLNTLSLIFTAGIRECLVQQQTDPRAFRESYKAPAILRALGLLDRSGQLTKEGHAARRGGK